MLDDIKNGGITDVKSELDVLNSILIKIWDLTSKLFSVQYYDTNNIKLYLEQINITHLLKNEVEVHTHINEHIQFIDRIDKNIWFVKIDKIQFWQVIENLISNAVKFIHGKDWIVCITAYKTKDSLIVSIEDNWEWFEWIEISELFDKYTKWNGKSIWLWMGLYLCKKIISMHDGIIKAWFSKEFSWAQFTITIPIKK
jgi:signal transduction histidine kinase